MRTLVFAFAIVVVLASTTAFATLANGLFFTDEDDLRLLTDIRQPIGRLEAGSVDVTPSTQSAEQWILDERSLNDFFGFNGPLTIDRLTDFELVLGDTGTAVGYVEANEIKWSSRATGELVLGRFFDRHINPTIRMAAASDESVIAYLLGKSDAELLSMQRHPDECLHAECYALTESDIIFYAGEARLQLARAADHARIDAALSKTDQAMAALDQKLQIEQKARVADEVSNASAAAEEGFRFWFNAGLTAASLLVGGLGVWVAFIALRAQGNNSTQTIDIDALKHRIVAMGDQLGRLEAVQVKRPIEEIPPTTLQVDIAAMQKAAD